MFDTLLESARKPNLRRGATALVSFSAQLLLLTIGILLPLFFTDALPVRRLVTPVEAPVAPLGSRTSRPPTVAEDQLKSELIGRTVLEPQAIPRGVALIQDIAPPASAALPGSYVPGAVPGTGEAGAGVIDDIIRSIPTGAPKVAKPRHAVSQGVLQGRLIRRIEPVYPRGLRFRRVLKARWCCMH
jgi:hypothetical protein